MVHGFGARAVTLIFRAYLLAAAIASIAALLGFFDVGGLAELFTRSQRARGTFKDPNVFGPFLIPAILYCVHAIERGRYVVLNLTLASLYLVALFLSFSRGAWFHLGVSLAVYLMLQALAFPNPRRLVKQIILLLGGLVLVTGVVVTALSSERVSATYSLRSSLVQEYDVGQGGRFDTQRKSIDYILTHPFGIGAGQSSEQLGIEPHNVYLYAFLETGWLGGFAFIALLIWITVASIRAVWRTPERLAGGLTVAFATFAGILIESLFIDSLHWRHSFLIAGVLLGYIALSLRAGRAVSRSI